MVVDVLVTVVLVDLEAQRGQLGQEDVGQTRVDEERQPSPWPGREQQLGELLAHPLRRDDLERRGALRHRCAHRRRDVEAELGGEARRPHHPQRVVGEGLLGGGRRHQPPVDEVVEAAVHVDELEARQPDRHGVDGEVAAHEVALERVAEHHLGLARRAVVDVGAVGRDLELQRPLAQPDRAELTPDVPVRVGPP